MMYTMLPALEINTWIGESLSNLVLKISNIESKPIILIDGIAGSGKTTLAAKLVVLFNANLIHTDDVSWCADPIHWDSEMIDGIINPWQGGNDVAYKPTGWIKENRLGSIGIDSNKALIIEGMGACRKSLRVLATYAIWVDTDPKISRVRVVERDLANGENGGTMESVVEFANWWDSLLTPFLSEEESWKYVDIIVSGSKSDLIANKLMVHVPEKRLSVNDFE